ncbi:MAG: putative peptidoglycan glycosyltransferase FtsW [Bacillota bacterium]|nr:putative peptidoglycan glycosyltransferase FtsW [Bacillota bacterium]
MFENLIKKRLDYPLLIATLMLLAVGLVMISSASSYSALELFDNRNKFFEQTIMWHTIGLVGMYVVSRISYKVFQRFSFVILLVCIAILIYPLFAGSEIRETRRWFDLFGFQIQPSEFAKAGLILYISAYLARKDRNPKTLVDKVKYYLIVSIPIAIIVGLIFLQPNKSTAAVTAALSGAILFIGGAPIWYLGSIIGAGGAAFFILSFSQEYSRERLTAYQNQNADPTGGEYQVMQSLIALGLGRVWGVGLGNSLQNKLYVPDPHNDFILAPTGEEFGMIGTVGILILYSVLIYRCIKIAFDAPDRFSAMVAGGVAALMTIHVVLNYAVVTYLVPTTGVTLPLISYGGSSTIVFMGLLGIVQNIARHRVKEKEKIDKVNYE